MDKDPEIFRSLSISRAAMPLLALAMCIVAGLCVRSGQAWWVSVGFVAFSIIAILATIEVWRVKFEITESHLRIVKLLKTTQISRESFHKFSSAKGCHPVIETKGGLRCEVPDLDISPHALGNKLRAWAKREHHKLPNKPDPTAGNASV